MDYLFPRSKNDGLKPNIFLLKTSSHKSISDLKEKYAVWEHNIVQELCVTRMKHLADVNMGIGFKFVSLLK